MTKTILTVGADSHLQALIKTALTAEGFELCFRSGDNAEPVTQPSPNGDSSRPAADKTPQLIICSIDGCAADGYVTDGCAADGCATHWQTWMTDWRQAAETALVPIIVLASAQNLSQARLAMEQGADDYLMAPFAPELLCRAIQARLQRQARLEGMQQQTHLLAQALKNELTALQAQFKDVKRVDELKSNLLKRAAQDLREPLSNINMALHLLKGAGSEAERDRYISVLESECVRELNLLDDISNVQSLLTPDNTLLLQKFQMLATS